MSGQQDTPTMLVYGLNEGFVLNYGGYTVALTNADDLAERVRTVAKELSGEVGFEVPAPEQGPVMGVPVPTQPIPPELREATAVPSAVQPVPQNGAVSEEQLVREWSNVQKLIAFMAAGFDSNGRMFTRKEWDAALPEFAPHVDPKEAEFKLGEFLSEMHEDD